MSNIIQFFNNHTLVSIIIIAYGLGWLSIAIYTERKVEYVMKEYWMWIGFLWPIALPLHIIITPIIDYIERRW